MQISSQQTLVLILTERMESWVSLGRKESRTNIRISEKPRIKLGTLCLESSDFTSCTNHTWLWKFNHTHNHHYSQTTTTYVSYLSHTYTALLVLSTSFLAGNTHPSSSSSAPHTPLYLSHSYSLHSNPFFSKYYNWPKIFMV